MKQIWRVGWISTTASVLNQKLNDGEIDINNIISIQRDDSWSCSENILVYYKYLVTIKESE